MSDNLCVRIYFVSDFEREWMDISCDYLDRLKKQVFDKVDNIVVPLTHVISTQDNYDDYFAFSYKDVLSFHVYENKVNVNQREYKDIVDFSRNNNLMG